MLSVLQLDFFEGTAGISGGLVDRVDSGVLECAAVLHAALLGRVDVRGGWSGTAFADRLMTEQTSNRLP